MSRVAVLGAGAGGAAAAVELVSAGHTVHLWNRSAATLEPFRAIGGIEYEGVLGSGRAAPRRITAELADALDGVDLILICLPSFLHAEVARALASAGLRLAPIVLNPGHTGGALEVANVLRECGVAPPPIAELSTLTYVARKYRPDQVTISGVAKQVRLAGLPGGGEAVAAARALLPASREARDVLATGLANVNLVLHPPGALLGMAWVEATGGDFRFYVDGVTPAVARVMKALDEERLAVAAAFGHRLPPLIEEMAAIGTADEETAARGDLAAAIRGGAANAKIRAPDSLRHRYYREDFGYGLLPFVALAGIAGVEVPVASSLLRLGFAAIGPDLYGSGRGADRMGVSGLDRAGLLALVRGEGGGAGELRGSAT